jgi:hypothetical protein
MNHIAQRLKIAFISSFAVNSIDPTKSERQWIAYKKSSWFLPSGEKSIHYNFKDIFKFL